jgi:hypothetical protein
VPTGGPVEGEGPGARCGAPGPAGDQPTVQNSLALPLQVYMSAVAPGEVEEPVTLRQSPELFPTIVSAEPEPPPPPPLKLDGL